MTRAFVAVDIDEKAKEKVIGLISYLKKSNADIKWVTENQMHLTLKFLGNIEKDKIEAISAALKSISANFDKFSISLDKIGVFPDMRRPRVLWLGIVKGKDILNLIAGQIEEGLEKLGFPKEKRSFKAHLTLGRVRSLKNIDSLAGLIKGTGFRYDDEIKIEGLTLFQSTLTPKGAIYAPLSQTKFSQ